MIPLNFSTPGVSSTPVPDRRAWPRSAPRPENCFVLLTAAGDKVYPGRILDVSVGGIAVLLSRRYDPGTLMAVDLRNNTAANSKTLLMRVARVAPRDDGSYLIAGTFTGKMPDADFDALVS